MLRVWFAVLALVIADCSFAAQQPPGAASVPRFNTEIVVTPERGATPKRDVPAATVVLESADLATLPAVHLSEVMSFLPGFVVARPQIFAGRPVVSARGFFGGGEAEYVRLLVDGMPVADSESGLIDWSAIPATSIRRVEAVRGPGASLYGDSAIGGVIQIFTDRLASEGQFTATGGSFQTLTGDGSYGRRFGRGGFTIAAAGRRTGGAFDHSSSDQVVAGGSADGLSRGLSWRLSVSGDTRDSADPGVLPRGVFAVDPYSSDPTYRFDGVDRQTFSAALVVRQVSSSWAPLIRVYTSARDEDLVRTIPLVPGFADTRARALSGSTVGGSIEAERRATVVRPLIARVGLDLSREQIDTTYRSVGADGVAGSINSTADGHRTRTGAFVSAAWEAAPPVRVTGGLRWDNVDDGAFRAAGGPTGEPQRAWSPRIGVLVRASERAAINVFGQLSRAFKAPTVDQLFDPRPYPDFQGGSFTISNPALVPQRATNVEAGISGTARVRWSALAYRMAVDDEIDFDPRTFSYANIGESRHTGVELEVEGSAWQMVRPSLTYAFSRVTSAGESLQLKNVPRQVLSLAAHVNAPWRIHVLGRYQRSWGAFLDDENRLPIDGASIVDLRVRRPVGKHMVFADILNLSGDTYEEYGFTLVGFTGETVPYVYAGAPRALRVGINIFF